MPALPMHPIGQTLAIAPPSGLNPVAENHACSIHKFSLGKCVSIGYTPRMMRKDVGMRIRIERELRDDFLAACQVQDRPAAQVIREFMRAFIQESGGGKSDKFQNTQSRSR